MHTLDQFTAVIGRDFEAKAPTGTDIRKKVETGAYTDRFSLLRDLGQNLFWVNRYSMTMFDKRPTRWRDLPRGAPTSSSRCSPRGRTARRRWPPSKRAWEGCRPPGTRPRSRRSSTCSSTSTGTAPPRHRAARREAHRGRVPRAPRRAHLGVPEHDPDYPVFGLSEILDAEGPVPELEALQRWAMVLHNQYPWDRSRTQLRPVSEIGDDDWVIAFHPHNRDVVAFLDRVRAGRRARAVRGGPAESPPCRRSGPTPPSTCARPSACSRAWSRSRWPAARSSATTPTSCATPASPGRR